MRVTYLLLIILLLYEFFLNKQLSKTSVEKNPSHCQEYQRY